LAAIESYRDLVVWQKSMDLAEDVYRLARTFPDWERLGLTSQLTRAIASVPANIAEGHGRATRRDCANFVAISRGSLQEAEAPLLLALRLGYLIAADAAVAVALDLMSELRRMLAVPLRRLRLEAGPPTSNL
jgi:four helix bundle protein